MNAIISIAASHSPEFSLMHVDVSRAYFHAKAQRPVLVKLPAEDCSGKDVGKIGLLKKSMYGTRDAASKRERDWQGHLESWGYELGRSSRNLFHNKKKKTSGLTHGDGFVVTGTKGSLLELKKQLESVYPIKASIIGAGSTKSIKALNRRICWRETGILYQHDPRHVDVLVESLGLENGNTVQTPNVDDVKDENPVWLDSEQISKYRSHVARCLFFSQDRADITFAVNELCQRMSDPSQHSFSKLKRLVRYLKGERQWIQVFEFGDMSSEVTVFSDSDWAGDKETRKSSSAGVGRHLLKAYTRKQKIIIRSSAEADLYAAALGASEAKEVQSMMCDLVFAVKPVLIIDAKATEHILHRHGIGKMKHIDVAHLWLQDEVKSNRLRVRRVKSEDKLADIGSKAISNKSSESMRYPWATWMLKRT